MWVNDSDIEGYVTAGQAIAYLERTKRTDGCFKEDNHCPIRYFPEHDRVGFDMTFKKDSGLTVKFPEDERPSRSDRLYGNPVWMWSPLTGDEKNERV